VIAPEGTTDFRLTVDGKAYEITISADSVSVDGQTFGARVERAGPNLVVLVDGRPYYVEVGETAGRLLIVGVDGAPREVELNGGLRAARSSPRAVTPPMTPGQSAGGDREVVAPMAGRITRVAVGEGDRVEAGDLLLILEAMKMENEIRATRPGVVRRVLPSAGDRVLDGQSLVEID
jgi:glutaconyl-CoA/methylmalonyl-CoA decarboxylase subunit gamma